MAKIVTFQCVTRKSKAKNPFPHVTLWLKYYRRSGLFREGLPGRVEINSDMRKIIAINSNFRNKRLSRRGWTFRRQTQGFMENGKRDKGPLVWPSAGDVSARGRRRGVFALDRLPHRAPGRFRILRRLTLDLLEFMRQLVVLDRFANPA